MLTLAAVDIGANSVRLKIARIVRKRLEILHEDREVVRLGESVFHTGALAPSAMQNAIRVLRRFQKATRLHRVTTVRVIATSALRDASNATTFIEWVQRSVGWHVEVVSGIEEGRLIHLGVVAHTRATTSRTLLIDLGGGSCELIVSRQRQIEQVSSLPLGAVRLTRQFLKHDPPTETEVEQLRSFLTEEIRRIRPQFTEHHITQVVATSGTPAALSELWAATVAADQAIAAAQSAKKKVRSQPALQAAAPAAHTIVPRAGLFRLTHRLNMLPVQQRRALAGIGPRRAEIIVAGAHVFSTIFAEFELKNFRYSPLGLRDGVLAEMALNEAGPGLQRRKASERQNSIQSLAEHYSVDRHFAARVAQHARLLFKQLAPLHGLPSEYAALLEAAAQLHEVGSFISRAGRRRHAHYILSNSELLGFSPAERDFVAALTRFLGKSKVTTTNPIVRALAPLDRACLAPTVLLLRLARALEQSRRGAITGLHIAYDARQVRFALRTRKLGAELELWALGRERAFFAEVFGRELICAES